ncbi:MAG: ABC transporter substrate-binding protein [Gammaproteobacteria bacterium]|nr:ABC transporter substrate-binding protein [Gammaproteobacteria bacterium]NIN37194.1 ABC transporter substrate-binding protein [Gammaproteobacteria bacterium]NIO26052.1 ABC transporter substrate-binding protein [Gammaproteobacteria bacterium]NIO66665.1 ABC transporter substrate-binding protein [Gammaproteobacteria bacterium]NIP46341.1 ABC transporter substrate-binding protein [Gammaproteobacteria bacterium]
MDKTNFTIVSCVALFLALLTEPVIGNESPMLKELVASGQLPPLEQRLPTPPKKVEFNQSYQSPGKHGGELVVLMGRSKDVRLMVVYGYARLVGYNLNFELEPDLLESLEVEDDRRFTLHLRKGHRWSDGHPFTAEAFRYYWEDIAMNKDLAAFGPPAALLVDGEPPVFEVIDDTTIRYTWKKPNPFFLPALAGARPEAIYAPGHYLKQFHARYTDVKELEALAEKEGRRNWASVHIARFRPYKNINPDLPSLQPWVNTTAPPSQRFVFVRNPYFHRVDPNGLQLPYIDRVVMDIADGKLIPAKTGAGESDLQARHINFSDYTFLKQSEKRAQQKVLLWDTALGSHIALYPNLNVDDAVWRDLLRDVRFRRALSLAIDRSEINQVIYYGFAREGNDTVFPNCPFYKKEYTTAWAEFDLKKANALLDEIGLSKRDDKGIRLLPDGRPLEIIVETAGESTEQVDVLELVSSTWRKAGIKLFSKPLQREVFRNRIYSGATLMSVWGGLENGLPTPDMSPAPLAPTRQDQYQWPKWGQYYETNGQVGEPPDISSAKELMKLNAQWLSSPSAGERKKIWQKMLDIRAQEVFTIGIVAGVPQPVVINKKLHNVPKKGIYNWDPGAHFGIYHPDTFWFEG